MFFRSESAARRFPIVDTDHYSMGAVKMLVDGFPKTRLIYTRVEKNANARSFIGPTESPHDKTADKAVIPGTAYLIQFFKISSVFQSSRSEGWEMSVGWGILSLSPGSVPGAEMLDPFRRKKTLPAFNISARGPPREILLKFISLKKINNA